MQISKQKGAPKHVHLPMSTAASYSDIYADGGTHLITFILVILSPPTHTKVRHMGPCPPLTTSWVHHICSPPSPSVLWVKKTLLTPQTILLILAQMELCFHQHTASSPVEPQNQTHSKPNWDKLSPMEIENLYTVHIEEQLSQIKCPTVEECLENPTLIDQHLTILTTLMLQTAHNSIPPKKFSPHKKQGWNDQVRQAQRTAQQAYKAWKAAGKPRSSDHPVCNYYKSSKGKFRSLLRQHKREERENFLLL